MQTFADALLDPERDAPPGLTDPQGAPAGRRFDVYRNNVAVSLTEALEQAFPVVRKLVGDEFFRAMAGIYLRRFPPRSPLLMFYGEEMPDFLAGFPPAASLPYLPDVARLELALRRAYHAADAAPIKTDRLAALSPEALMSTRLTLAPAVHILRSDWPIHAIWAANMRDGPRPVMRAECVLVARPEFDPAPHLIDADQAAFLAALHQGRPLGAALDAAGPSLDLAATLALLLATGAITNITEGTDNDGIDEPA